jgi:hypothetical protein
MEVFFKLGWSYTYNVLLHSSRIAFAKTQKPLPDQLIDGIICRCSLRRKFYGEKLTVPS